MLISPFFDVIWQQANKTVALLLLLPWLAAETMACEPTLNWRTEYEQTGLTVWQAEDNQQRTWIKAQAEVETNYWGLLNLLRDTDSATKWIDNVIKVQSIPNSENYTDLVYSEFYAPWPFSNRMMSTQSTLRFFPSDEKLQIVVTQHPDFYDSKHLVAMQEIEGCWVAEQISISHSLITWSGTAKPGGMLPDWLVRSTMKKSTIKTFLGLQSQLQQKKYQGKPLAYPEVP